LTKPRHILVFRFSALGDVAMTVPVIKLILQQHPELQITFVSTLFVRPLFENIERLHFFAADLKGKHKGVAGLYRLYREIKRQVSFDAVADLHNVLRTKMLRFYFAFSGPVAFIIKGRDEKKKLTRKKYKILKPLTSTFQRYADVFKKLGVEISLSKQETKMQTRTGSNLIGLAPFAKHAEKMYPLESMKDVIRLLTGDAENSILLFGSKAEAEILKQWEQEFPNTQCFAGTMSLQEELVQISKLDVMVSMDSANMHLASLFDVPVVSIWGATHPFAGFYGWQQPEGNAVQVDLYCRPCSVFGDKKCYRGDHACMHSIAPETIYKKILEVLNNQI
jgi:ADP-heptose:LPS heptosyltransferase